MAIMVGMSLKAGVKWLWNTSRGYRIPILASVLVGTARIGVSLTFVWLCKYLIDIATRHTDGDIVSCLCLLCSVVFIRIPKSAFATGCGITCLNIFLRADGMGARLFIRAIC